MDLKHSYQIIGVFNNQDVLESMGAALHIGNDKWIVVFNIINLDENINLQYIQANVKMMIKAFDKKVKVGKEGIIGGPSYCEVDFKESGYAAVRAYVEYVESC